MIDINNDKETLENKISFIFSNDYCKYVIESPVLDFSLVCEGDCEYCRFMAITKLFNVVNKELLALKQLAIPCDNNTRCKIDKPTFDSIISNLLNMFTSDKE